MRTQNKSVSFVSMLVLLLLVTVAPLQAASINVTEHRQYSCGTSRCVSLKGAVSLAPGESVREVRIFVNGPNGPLAQAQGQYNSTTKTWSVGIGDYQLVSYYVAITIVKSGRVIGAVKTPVYFWGQR